MLSSAFRTLLLGFVFLLLGGVLVYLGLARARESLMVLGAGSFLLSGAVLALGSWLARNRPDPLDRRREQRLWKSGPLGRRWLKARRRIP